MTALAAVGEEAGLLVDPARREREEQRLGLPLEDILERRAALVSMLLDLADEARDLIGAGWASRPG